METVLTVGRVIFDGYYLRKSSDSADSHHDLRGQNLLRRALQILPRWKACDDKHSASGFDRTADGRFECLRRPRGAARRASARKKTGSLDLRVTERNDGVFRGAAQAIRSLT